MTLPVNVGKGYVTGTFMDSSGAVASGTITFTPSPAKILDATSTPPTTVLPLPVTVNLASGTFLQQLVATNDVDLNPFGFTYTVSFALTIGSAPVTVAPFSISVPEGLSSAAVDLTLVSPVPSSNGTAITRGIGVPDPATGTDGQAIVLVGGVPVWGSVAGGVPTTRQVNGHALSSDVVVTNSDVKAPGFCIEVTGVYPNRQASTAPVFFIGPDAPSGGGTTAGGAGAVNGLDLWLQTV